VSARRLIVSGDDFGAAPEVNRAIVRAHREGILTSTSLMVTGAAAAEAVALARANPGLAVGLHLVLVQGTPAASREDIPHLVTAAGRFGDEPVSAGIGYAWQCVRGEGRVELRREVEAQLTAFAATGLPLAHVDGHLNMHLHPMVLAILIELAPRFGIGALRLSRESLGSALAFDASHLVRKLSEGVVFHALARWATPRLGGTGIRTADRVYGMHQTGHVDERYLLELIPRLPDGVSELYCHPSEGAPAGFAAHQPGYDNAGELAALTSPRVRKCIQDAGVELVSYRDLPSN